LAHLAQNLGAKFWRSCRTICYLAGGLYSNICFFCGISVTAFYRSLWQTIHAINKAIVISFQSTPKDCANLALGFESISCDGVVIKNWVGAVDSYSW
jgi:hypothetical protein